LVVVVDEEDDVVVVVVVVVAVEVVVVVIVIVIPPSHSVDPAMNEVSINADGQWSFDEVTRSHEAAEESLERSV
jgi:hypothetical protein